MGITLEIRTLVFANTIVWVFSTALLVIVWRTRKTYPGFGVWTLESVAVTLGFLLLALRGAVPDVASVMGGNGMLGTGAILGLVGVGRFLDRPVPWRVASAALMALLAVLAWYLWIEPDLGVRVVAVGLYLSATVGAAAWILLSPSGVRYRPSSTVLAGILLVYVAASVYRVVQAFGGTFTGDFMRGGVDQVIIFTSSILLGSGSAFAIVLMNHQRLEEDLLESLRSVTEKSAQIRTLEGLLPICSSCKKIRDEVGAWTRLEAYIRDHSRAEFTHGICPDCASKLYADYQEP